MYKDVRYESERMDAQEPSDVQEVRYLRGRKDAKERRWWESKMPPEKGLRKKREYGNPEPPFMSSRTQ
jgi:hypothetical protein